jgi:nitroimidazol reductase NimA-like FMN-containing flavoprotein (pyridoxamine 5'-phosphate oxidase superfamily)
MRKKNQEITDNTILEEIIADSEICRVAMIDGEVPYILPFNYGYKDQCIYIHSASEGKKIDLLKKNNKVCFEIEQKAEIVAHEIACKWATTYRSVVGYAEVGIIADFNKKEEGLKIIMAHYGVSGETSFEKIPVDSMVILKLTITEITGKQSKNWDKTHNT